MIGGVATTLRWLLRNDLVETAIIFANRKTTVRELNKSLLDHGFKSGEIHGDMDQSARLRTLQAFRNTLPFCTTDRSQKHNCDTFDNLVPRSGFRSGAR